MIDWIQISKNLDKIRLTDSEKKTIFLALHLLSENENAYIFGSRTDLNKRGDDIDFMVFSQRDKFKLIRDLSSIFDELNNTFVDIKVFDPSDLSDEEQRFLDLIDLIQIYPVYSVAKKAKTITWDDIYFFTQKVNKSNEYFSDTLQKVQKNIDFVKDITPHNELCDLIAIRFSRLFETLMRFFRIYELYTMATNSFTIRDMLMRMEKFELFRKCRFLDGNEINTIYYSSFLRR